MSMLPYIISETSGSCIVEFWAEPYVIYHTVQCLTLEPAYGLESSAVHNLQHAILHFSPRAIGYLKDVQWLLDYWTKETEEDYTGKAERERLEREERERIEKARQEYADQESADSDIQEQQSV